MKNKFLVENYLNNLKFDRENIVYRVTVEDFSYGVINEEIIQSKEKIEDFRTDYLLGEDIYVNKLIFLEESNYKYLDEYQLSEYIRNNINVYIILPEEDLIEMEKKFCSDNCLIISTIFYKMWIEKRTLLDILNNDLRKEILNPSWEYGI